ncbi:hypothetical protein EST38_g13540 [Candolleomyces aberdarensis]|uniref:Uncharacterized protein n=1 Tax=Candolleomyces aberdarensis TaxID=2316362 RepID=A0A4Q2D1Z1_9AGAR|nr:hypothetical protein EST38_g13540 [Candolleomyces aberdarensis]
MPKVPTPAKRAISTKPIDPFALIQTKHGHTNQAVSLDPRATPKVATPAKGANSTEPVDPFTLMGMPPIQPGTRRRLIGAGPLGKVDEEVPKKVDKGKGKQKTVSEGVVGQPMDVDEDQEGGIDDDDLSWLDDAEESKGQLGRIPKAQWERIKQVAKRVVEEIKQGAVEAGRGTNITIHEINKHLKVKITSHLTLWNIYMSYWWSNRAEEEHRLYYKISTPSKSFAKFQEEVPDWEEHLLTWWTLLQKASIVEDRGFPIFIVACGSIVHHEQGIRATRVSHAIEELLLFLDLAEDSLLGDMKTHSYAHIEKTNQEARLAKRTEKGKDKADVQSSGDDDKENATSVFSTSAGTADDGFTAQVAALGDDSLLRLVRDARAALESVTMKWDYKLLRNMIKVVLTACFYLTGASWESEAYLTWDKIVLNMATAGVAIEERPVGLVFLGQIPSKSSGGR